MFRLFFPNRNVGAKPQADRSMEKTGRRFSRLLRSDDGATAVEYAVMLSLIIAACATGITLVGQATLDSFEDSSNKIDQAFNGSGGGG